MNLNDLKPKKDTLETFLVSPVPPYDILTNKDGSEMTITVYGPHSVKAKEVLHEIANKRIKKMAQGKKQTLTFEEIEDANIEELARLTTDWNITLEGDEPEPFSVAKAKEVYSEFPWIKAQVMDAANDVASFIQA
jgi:molybdenum cofactor biosynthesis enzyme MoaA